MRKLFFPRYFAGKCKPTVGPVSAVQLRTLGATRRRADR